MDIHKPKAAHSWREFLIEIGTIICGILIALGLEQSVEWIHRTHSAEQAEGRIRKELAYDLAVASERIAVAKCLDEQLSKLRDQLLAPGPEWPGVRERFAAGIYEDTMPPVYRPPGRSWRQAAWTSAIANGSLNTAPPELVGKFASLYAVVSLLSELQSAEAAPAASLGDLAYPGRLTEEERRRDLKAVSAAAMLEARIIFDAKLLVKLGSSSGIEPEKQKLAEATGEQRRLRGACVDASQ